MGVGKLREKVTIESEQSTPDGMGGYVLAWQAVATVWSRVTPERGIERVQSGRLAAEKTYSITIRYRSDINESMRMVWNGQLLNIRHIANADERKRYLTLTCEEGVAV